jgi:hypothetical protein
VVSLRIVRGVRGAVAVALVVAGCGSPVTGSPAAATSPAASGSARPSVVPAGAASQPAGSSPVASPTDNVITFQDPNLVQQLPAGWRFLAVLSLRGQLETSAAAAPAAARTAYQDLLRQIDAGEIRGGGAGPAGLGAWQGTTLVAVATAASIDAEIAANESLQAAFAKPSTRTQTTVTLSIGQAVRVMTTAEPPGGTASGAVAARAISYYVDLGGGRILWEVWTGPEASAAFQKMADDSMATVTAR